MKQPSQHQSTTALVRQGVRRHARAGAVAIGLLTAVLPVPALLMVGGVAGAVAAVPAVAILAAVCFLYLCLGDLVDEGLAAGLQAAHAAVGRGAGDLSLSKAVFAALIAIGSAPGQARARAMLPPAPKLGSRSVADLNLTPRLCRRPFTSASIAGVM